MLYSSADNYFALIMGEDNLLNFHKWKNHDIILAENDIYVYPRVKKNEDTQSSFEAHPNVKKVEAPIMEISSTFIRKAIAAQKNIKPLLNNKVWEYIDLMNFYK